MQLQTLESPVALLPCCEYLVGEDSTCKVVDGEERGRGSADALATSSFSSPQLLPLSVLVTQPLDNKTSIYRNSWPCIMIVGLIARCTQWITFGFSWRSAPALSKLGYH